MSRFGLNALPIVVVTLLAAVVGALVAPPALAQPGGKVLRIVVPFAAGGGREIPARAIYAELGQALGMNAIVESRGGAGGTIGAAQVAKAEPDGLTLLLAGSSHLVNGLIYPKLAYDPIRDFAPVAMIGTTTYVLVTTAELPVRTAGEFVRHVRANPEKLNYSSAGHGSSSHLAMAYFTALHDLRMVHLPFKSSGEATNEVLSGRAHAMIVITTGALSLLKDQRVRLLGTTSRARSAFLPDLPTVNEGGAQGYEFDSWFGLVAPAATPPAVVERINAAVNRLLADPAMVERYAKQGVDVRPMTPAALGDYMRADLVKLGPVVKAAGTRIE